MNIHTAALAAWRRQRARTADRTRLQREQPHRLAFEAFYERLPLDPPPFYMFFTTGLLHWATKTLEFVPPGANVVLIGSALTPEEVEYVTRRVQRPFHNIELRVADSTVWQWLFEVNRTDFGWLDVDCLVLNPALFSEMSTLTPDVAMNGCWRTYQGWGFLATYFLFINREVLTEVRKRMPDISPRMYHPESDYRPRSGYANVLEDRHRALAASVGSPKPSFDTTQFYQLAAHACGYSLHGVRELHNDPQFATFCSPELLHITGVSWYRGHYLHSDSPFTHDLVMRGVIDYLLLRASDPALPANYAAVRDHVRRMLGGRPERLATYVHQFLLAKGLDEQVFRRPGLEFLQYEGERRASATRLAALAG